MLGKNFHKEHGKNIKIYNMYYRKKDNTLIVDKYTTIEEILKDKRDLRVIANDFRDRANAIANVKTVEDLKKSNEELLKDEKTEK